MTIIQLFCWAPVPRSSGGEVVFSPEDEYGQALEAFDGFDGETDGGSEDFMALIRKPPKEMLEQQLAPFTTKAYQDGGRMLEFIGYDRIGLDWIR